MSDLQARVKAFLMRPVPEDMDYMPDSLAERFLIQYAEDGHLTLEPETAEILATMVEDEETNSLEQCQPGEREYLDESRKLLAAILEAEVRLPSWPAPYLFATQTANKPWWRFW